MTNKDYDLAFLSDGISNMPRQLTTREWLSDQLFFYLQMTSRFVFIFGGIIGYAINGLIDCVMLLTGGWLLGIWMRRSLGRRGSDPVLGYFRRIKERANGSRRGVLEWAIETVRGSGFTISKCQAITVAYEQAMKEYNSTNLPDQQQEILKRLDKEVKRISYSM